MMQSCLEIAFVSPIMEKNEKLLEMEHLYYTIAHDFKATIVSIKSFSEILSKQYFDKTGQLAGFYTASDYDAVMCLALSL